MSLRSTHDQDEDHAANTAGTTSQLPLTAVGYVLPSFLTPQIPLDNVDFFPPTPHAPLRALPAIPLHPLPVIRFHSTLTDITFQWDVRLNPEPTQLSLSALSLPAFDSPPGVKSFTLHFAPLAGMPSMDYTYAVTASTRGTPISIGRVLRSIHLAVHATLEPTALPQGDPLRRHVERAYHRRTSRPFNTHADVLRNVDLHMVGRTESSDGLYFHGITVEEVAGPHGLCAVFRVLLRDYRPFA